MQTAHVAAIKLLWELPGADAAAHEQSLTTLEDDCVVQRTELQAATDEAVPDWDDDVMVGHIVQANNALAEVDGKLDSIKLIRAALSSAILHALLRLTDVRHRHDHPAATANCRVANG